MRRCRTAAARDDAPKQEERAASPSQAETDKAVEAINAARAAVVEALNKAPLGFRRILFVKDVPEGFAAYKPRADNVFAADEPLIVYTEPIGVAWKKDGDEFSSKLVVDFEIRLARRQSARRPARLRRIRVAGARAAARLYEPHQARRDRRARGLLHSRPDHPRHNSGKSTSTDLPFEIK